MFKRIVAGWIFLGVRNCYLAPSLGATEDLDRTQLVVAYSLVII